MAKPPKEPSKSRSLRKIRRVASRRMPDFPAEPGAKYVAELKSKLKGKDRDKIVNAALQKLVLSEALKPYQAELIRMQFHLEATGRNLRGLADARKAVERPAELGELEISVTPAVPLDRDVVRRFEDLGVHRLVAMAPARSADDVVAFVEKTAEALLG